MILAVASVTAQVSKDGAWVAGVAQKKTTEESRAGWITPEKYAPFTLNVAALKKSLAKAGEEISAEVLEARYVLELPMPDGELKKFKVIESPVMAPGLAAKFPGIKTYRGVAVDDPTVNLRMSLSPSGFSAQILSPSGACYIDRLYQDDVTSYACYHRKDYSGALAKQPLAKGEIPKAGREVMKCLVDQSAERPAVTRSRGVTAARSSGATLRTYRIAVAATGEYTAYHGGTRAEGQAAIVQAINRVTGVFEQELAIRLELVANNDLLVFTDAGSDPYDNEDADQMIDINGATINGILGSSSAYDIGHVFSTGGGGLAGLGVVCGSRKAEGVTGRGNPVGDLFWIDYVAHEIGHQFGAEHTFNGSDGSCGGGNRNPSTAYEPGAGSTIMAYAGICGSDNIQSASDPIFSTESYDQIRAHAEGTSCAVTSATGNAIPAVSAGDDYTIPSRTPFELTAVGADADGTGSLTYLWEERSLGPAGSPSDPDNGSSPIFRVWTPDSNPVRTFPRLSDLLDNTLATGEQLPTAGRTMDFRATVRDNASGGGGVNQDDMQLTVVATAGPFLLTSPNTSVSLSGNTTVTWNVANTNLTPILTSHVDILLSTDGGNTYGSVLLVNTPNDGSADVVLPAVNTTTARIKVKAVNNVYFDISDANFTITPPAGPTFQINDVVVSEGDSGTTQAVLTVTLAPTSASTVTVDYATSNGTATAGSDYVAKSGTLQFDPGVSSQQLSITVNGDMVMEPDETLNVTLSGAVNGLIGDGVGMVTIQNDEPEPPTITSASTASGALNNPFYYQISATSSPTSYALTGALPGGLIFNTLSGVISGTPTATGSFPVTIQATNATGTGSQSLTITVVSDPITDGVDSTGVAWSNDGSADWYRITGGSPTTYDGVDAVRSGSIGNSFESALTATVTGPDVLSFYWKVSSEDGYDFLRVELDGGHKTSITGEVAWSKQTIQIPSGTHQVRWLYVKDSSDFSGQDAGFLDQVELASSSPEPYILSGLDITGVTGSPFRYQIVAAQDPTSYGATNLPPGLSINTATGMISGTPTQSGTFIVSLSATNADGTGTADLTLSFGVALNIAAALDAEDLGLPWIGGGDSLWFPQTSVTYDGEDAAEGGAVDHDEESVLQTMVTGPDVIMFQWKVSSEIGYDFLRFEMDGAVQEQTSGEQAWSRKMFFIPSGQHTLRWRYIKDGSASEFEDTGYVDEVSLLSKTFRISNLELTGVNHADVNISFPSISGLKYAVWRSLDMQSWEPVFQDIAGNGSTITVTHSGGGGNLRYFYRVTALPE